MSDLVPADRIEAIVGVSRHPWEHWGRAVSAEQTVYILHSVACRDSGIDLRDCAYSIALDNGINDLSNWIGREDTPVQLSIDRSWLIPVDRDPEDIP
jgi:hypothetical protein